MAAYDAVFALGDKDKATELLTEVSNRHGTGRIKTSLYAVNALRIKDQAPLEELAYFGQFCATIGLDFNELTKPDVAETIIADAIFSAVRINVEKTS